MGTGFPRWPRSKAEAVRFGQGEGPSGWGDGEQPAARTESWSREVPPRSQPNELMSGWALEDRGVLGTGWEGPRMSGEEVGLCASATESLGSFGGREDSAQMGSSLRDRQALDQPSVALHPGGSPLNTENSRAHTGPEGANTSFPPSSPHWSAVQST